LWSAIKAYESKIIHEHTEIPSDEFDRVFSDLLNRHGIIASAPFIFIGVSDEEKALMFKLEYEGYDVREYK